MNDSETKAFKDQNYEELKAECDEENLFEDPEFPASDESLYYNQLPPYGVKWMRPKEAMEDAKFVVDGYGRCDMDQGYIGNCWFIAGCVGILSNKKLFAKVVPKDQSFSDNYAGIFHFRFWLYGEWVDVVIDDRLPFWSDGNLVFCSNKGEPNEFWGPLLEKAYAKLYGSYENLEAGQTYDALIDMSGGIQEQFDLAKMRYDERENFWEILKLSFEQESIMSASINPDEYVREARLSNGLVRGHAFTITKLVVLDKGYEVVRLMRIRNPWGNEVEWNGAWSDNSREWDSISESIKDEFNLVKEADGEFWMTFEDFIKNFDIVQICHLTASSYSSEMLDQKIVSDHEWKCSIYESSWRDGETAGGCGHPDKTKYWINPQFLIKLVDYGHYEEDDTCGVLIALMQKDSRLKRMHTQGDSAEEFIQFRLYKINDDVDVDENDYIGLRLYANQLTRVGGSGSYINSREVTKRFKVAPGNYIIIPSTYDEGHDCEFMLRIFTELPVDTNMKSLEWFKDELDEDDTYIEPNEEDDSKRHYRNYLNPRMYKDKFKEWIKSSHFNVDYEDNTVKFGNEKVEFNLAHGADSKFIGARFGKYNFGFDYSDGFKFRRFKNGEED